MSSTPKLRASLPWGAGQRCETSAVGCPWPNSRDKHKQEQKRTKETSPYLPTGSSSSSVVMWVIRARFFTRPQASPSGVSAGQSIPHCEACKARGPLTLRVFSNCELMRCIMPKAEIKDKRDSTAVTPARDILKRFTDQFPVEMARFRPLVIVSLRMLLRISKTVAFCFGISDSACFFN